MVTPLLIEAAGSREAKRRLLIGDEFDAEEAQRIGLVQEVVPRDEVRQAVERYLDHIETADPATLSAAEAVGATGRGPLLELASAHHVARPTSDQVATRSSDSN